MFCISSEPQAYTFPSAASSHRGNILLQFGGGVPSLHAHEVCLPSSTVILFFQFIGELEDIPTSADMSGRGYLLTQLDTQRVSTL